MKLRSTLLRTCLVFVDLVNGNAENLWHILELNDPETGPMFLSQMGASPTIIKLTFRIPVGQCVGVNKYHRLLPFFMAPCWVPGLKLMAVLAVNDDLTSKLFIAHLGVKTDEDKDDEDDEEYTDCDSDDLECDYYECSSKAVKNTQEFFSFVQFKFVSENTYSAEMTAEQLKRMYVIDIFADNYTEDRNHLVYSTDPEPKWSVTKNLLSLSAELIRRFTRFSKKHTTAMSICPEITRYTAIITKDGGKDQDYEGQRQGKSNHTETSDDNCAADFRDLRGGGP